MSRTIAVYDPVAPCLSILVAGGAGSHSVFVPVSAHTRSVTREIVTFE